MEEFTRALQLHQAGQLRDAEIGYRQVLAENPQHADALHLLGVIAHQCGHHQDASQWITRAIAVNPNCAAYYSNLADVYRVLGRADEAVDACRQALRIDPGYPDALNNLGLAKLSLHEYSEAQAAFEQVIQQQPGLAAAHSNLGNALREQDRSEEAIEAYRTAVRLAPDSADVHNNLGQMLLEADEVDDAWKHCREAVRLKPDFPQAHSNLGNVLREQGQLESADACYREALRLNDRIGMIHNNVAQLRQEQGELDEAIAWYGQALVLDPDSARIHANLASALTEQEQYQAAVSQYGEAIRLQPDYAEAYVGLGNTYQEMEDNDRAIESFREAIRLKPSLAGAHTSLGQALAEAGRLKESLAAFRLAIDQDPKAIGAWTNIATHHRQDLRPEDVAQIERLLSEPHLKAGSRGALQFALAHVYDADGQYQQAAAATRLANAAQLQANRQRGRDYSPEESSHFAFQLSQAFDEEYFAKLDTAACGSKSNLPVFIIGLPRSGTTLTEQIMASHRSVHGAGELRLARQSFESLLRDPEDESVVDRIARLTAEQIQQCSDEYAATLRSLNSDAARIVDKMPDNYLYLGWIVTMFPNARIIHCRRDLRDVALSCWITSFKSIRWANDMDHIAARIENYQRLMNHWRSVLPLQILELDYEETVTNLPEVARRLVDWIGLAWDEQCIQFHQTDRPIRTASVSQVRQRVYSRSVARWKHYEHDLADLFSQLDAVPR